MVIFHFRWGFCLFFGRMSWSLFQSGETASGLQETAASVMRVSGVMMDVKLHTNSTVTGSQLLQAAALKDSYKDQRIVLYKIYKILYCHTPDIKYIQLDKCIIQWYHELQTVVVQILSCYCLQHLWITIFGFILRVECISLYLSPSLSILLFTLHILTNLTDLATYRTFCLYCFTSGEL